MKRTNLIIDIISILLILLFSYASITKLLDYDNFQIQLSKSPMLVQVTTLTAWFIPSIELIVAGLLIFNKTRIAGLYGSLTLMSLFTFYIIAILNFSEHIPCSCGGVLDKLNW